MNRSRTFAGFLMLVAGTVSLVFACLGPDRCLEVMQYHVAIGMTAALGLVSLYGMTRCLRTKRMGLVLLHLGFALVLGGWVYNAWCGPEDGSLRLRRGQTGQVADVGEIFLESFDIRHWPDTGSVRQYESRVKTFRYGDAPTEEGTALIAVNHPYVLRRGFFDPGWWVYQNSYEELMNPHTGKPLYFTILMCVKDVGLGYAFLGGLLMLVGAILFACRKNVRAESVRSCDGVCVKPVLPIVYVVLWLGMLAMLIHRAWSTGHAPMQNMYEFLMCAAAMVPVLTFLSWRGERDVRIRVKTLLTDVALVTFLLMPVAFFMDGRVKHLMPALQSPFFIPHVGAYVFGYILLIRAAFGVGRGGVRVGFACLTLGLVLGATWGKVCWGHWWQFDPKEMWSLATWFVYGAYFHFMPRPATRAEKIFLRLGAVLIVLTLTWINLSRLFTGVHSYA